MQEVKIPESNIFMVYTNRNEKALSIPVVSIWFSLCVLSIIFIFVKTKKAPAYNKTIKSLFPIQDPTIFNAGVK